MGYKLIIQTECKGHISEEVNETVDLIQDALTLVEGYTAAGVSGIRKSKIVSIIILRED